MNRILNRDWIDLFVVIGWIMVWTLLAFFYPLADIVIN